MSITWLNSNSPLLLSPSLFLFLPLTSDSSSASWQTFLANRTLPTSHPTHSCLCMQRKNKKTNTPVCCFPPLPFATVAEKKERGGTNLNFEWGGKSLTWFTGKCLGCVVTEDDRNSVLFCLPRHPGNVLDVMELSDLKRKERMAAAHYLEWTQQAAAAASLNCRRALLHWKCNSC